MKRMIVLVALIVAVLPVVLLARSATGLQPLGSFSGGPFDTVNNANLNVHFEIPIVNKAGRGLPFSYVLAYDSLVWQPVGSGGTRAWTPVWGSTWGFRAITSVGQTGYVSYLTYPTSCSFSSTTYYWTVYYDWQYRDPLGGVHSFSNAAISTYPNPPNTAYPCGGGPPATQTGLMADDNSAYSIASISVCNQPISCANALPTYTVLTAANGSQINAPLQQTSGTAATIDRNGNKISVSAGLFTDTLGTTALTVSGGGGSPTVLSYVNGSGSTSTFTVNYQSYTVHTYFNCSNINEYSPQQQQYLIRSITLPDATSYTFTYEPTPGDPSSTTGRLASVTLPAGGTISYTYSGGGTGVNGITCADGTPATLTRVTPDSATGWQYAHSENGTNWSTVLTAPAVGSDPSNQTSMSFQSVTTGTDSITYGYETQRLTYQGSAATGTLLQTIDTCYPGANGPCTGTTISFPIAQVTVTTSLGADNSSTTLQNKRITYYNASGLPYEVRENDYGKGSPGSLIRETYINYASLGNNIVNMPASIGVYDRTGALVSQQKFRYDETSVTVDLGYHAAASTSYRFAR